MSESPPRRQISGLVRLGRLSRKELRETLRDRRTIITLVVMPLLVYPLLSIIFHQFLLTGVPAQDDAPEMLIVGVASAEEDELLSSLLSRSTELLKERGQGPADLLPAEASVETALREQDRPQNLLVEPRADFLSRLQEGATDVAVEIRRSDAIDQSPGRVIVHFRPDSPRSRRTADLLQQRLRLLNDRLTAAKLRSANLPGEPPLAVNLKPMRFEAPAGRNLSLSALVPVVLVLMTVTGAVYPAIDLTAGERERNTLESLVAAPIARIQLLLAKYVAVLTVALLTAGVNLLGMLVTLQTTGAAKRLLGEGALTFSNLTAVLALLVLFAAFYSAVLLAITSFARSFKEAQAYLIPLMLLSLGPALGGLMPIQLGPLTSIAPLINVVLLARDLLAHDITSESLIYGGIAIISTLLYAAAAMALAARVFGSDSILYGSEQSWSDLWRRPNKPAERPTPTMLATCFAFLFPLYVLASGALGQLAEQDLSKRLLLSAGVTIAIFTWLPTHLAALRNVRWRGAFLWHRPPALSLFAAAILGCSLWPIAHELVLLSQQLGLANLSPARLTKVRALVDEFREVSPVLVLICLALVPAICEELFFRGFLLSALRQHVDAAAAIAISAVSFGLFHTLAGHLLMPERLFSSAFIGLFLAWIAWRTNSVLPSMLLHVTNNGLLLSIALFSTDFEKSYGLSGAEARHLPATWLAASGLGITIGTLLTWWATRRAPLHGASLDAAAAHS